MLTDEFHRCFYVVKSTITTQSEYRKNQTHALRDYSQNEL